MATAQAPQYDVIIIGYGPVGQALALMLARQGRRVAVCERWQTRYPLPRAVCIDHELYRVLCAIGMEPDLADICQHGPLYQWFNADWRELLVIDWSVESISGGPEVNFVHQPTLEEALDRAVAATGVDVLLGQEAIAVTQDETSASVRLRARDGGGEQTLSARYLVGCDGANSLVRDTIGGGREDLGFEADWLVIDVLLKEGVTIESLGIPAAGQYCNPTRPTTIVPAGKRHGRVFRRWEFMRLPGERNEDLEGEATVWRLLEPWAGPDDIELVRHKIYNFRSLIADRWRDRRLLIAGDAAHVMPPFMGQGMCAGLRDGWNLAWKLGLILDGTASDRLLDSYQPERRPHVRALVDASIYLGRIICIPDAEQAAARDRAFLDGTAEPPPPFPHLTDGLIHRLPDGTPAPGAGLLAPHVRASRAGRTGRLDDLLGPGWLLLATTDPAAQLGPAAALLDRLGTRVACLADPASPRHITDLDGRLAAFLDAQGWTAMLVRPDFHVYGGAATPAELAPLLADLAADLARFGLPPDRHEERPGDFVTK